MLFSTLVVETGLKRAFKARFHYGRRKEHSLFVLLIFFCARFNRRSIKERKNALFRARSGNGPLLRTLLSSLIKFCKIPQNSAKFCKIPQTSKTPTAMIKET